MDVKTDSHQKMHRGIRNSNIELFRIISMLVIVAHHYVANSGVINEIVGITEPQLKDYFLLIWGWGGKTGINCFVLITGYFMCKSQITAEKFIKLLAEVEFYNIIIYAVFCLTGYTTFAWKAFLDGIILFKSISDGFTPCFLLFYLLIPFLNKLISALTEKEHRLLLEWCLVVYTLIPSLGGWTAFNYITWFSVIYLVAAYLRLYPKDWFENGKLCAVAAAGTLLLSWLSVVGIAYFTSKTETGLVWPYYWVADSNKLLALATAVSAFLFFKNLKIGCSKGINTVAASAFGVLCIHANSDTMRQWLWRDTCNNLGAYQTSYAVIHAIGCVVVIYAVCTLLDSLRIRLLERPLLCWLKAKGKNCVKA